jgi:hypothetical protein
MIAARSELGLAVLVGALAVFLLLAAPDYMGGDQPLVATVAPLAIAAIGFTFGFVWMVRLARAHRVPANRHWRYRDD